MTVTEGLKRYCSKCVETKAVKRLPASLLAHEVSYKSFSNGRVEIVKGTPLLCTGFIFALRGATRGTLELNTSASETTKRALWLIRGTLGLTSGALGPSIKYSLGWLQFSSGVTLGKNLKWKKKENILRFLLHCTCYIMMGSDLYNIFAGLSPCLTLPMCPQHTLALIWIYVWWSALRVTHCSFFINYFDVINEYL